MSFWIAVVLLSAVTLLLLTIPFWRKSKDRVDRAEFELSVFKDQLKELDRDLERGLIKKEDAETARVEIQRRLLHADEMRNIGGTRTGKVSKTSIGLGAVGGVVIVVGSLLVYNKLGMPGYVDMPYAERDLSHATSAPDDASMNQAIAMLQKRLEENPTDVDAWLLLGRTMRSLERLDDSMRAFARAVEASDRHPAVLADYVEAKIYANQGEVSEDTTTLLQEAITGDPAQLKARFYLGYAKAREEDYEAAIQVWTDLAAMATPQAPWLPQVKNQIQMAAEAANLNPADFEPSAQARVLAKQLALEWDQQASQAPQQNESASAPGPTREQMEEAQQMSGEDRSAMIRTMVQRLADRLKDEPNDIEGWKRLANAYQVLGETEKAQDAFEKVKELEGQ